MLQKNLLILLLLISGINAQVLTLEECIQSATTSHPDIKKFTLQLQKNSKGVEIANANYLPQVTATAEYDFQKTYAFAQNGVFNTIDDDGWQVGISIKQKIWDFSKTISNIKAYEVQEDISKLSLKEAKTLIAYKVKLQYELMIVQKEAIRVREKDIQTKEELYKQAVEQVKLGMKTEADTSRFLSSVYMAKSTLAIAKAEFQKAKIKLSNLIDKDIDDNVQLIDTISKNSLEVKDIVIEDVLSKNLQIQSLNKTIEKNKLLYKSAKASRYGSIDAIASYNHIDSLSEYDSSLVGVLVRIPLYSGNKISATTEQAILQKQIAKEILNSKELALKDELESLFIDLKKYDQILKAKKAQLKASEDTKILLKARYKEGIATYVETLDALTLYLNAKLDILEARYAKSSIINRIKYLKGKTS